MARGSLMDDRDRLLPLCAPFATLQCMAGNCRSSSNRIVVLSLLEWRLYAVSSTDKIFPAGSLNHAIVGPFPREIPRASVFNLGSS